MTPSQENTHLIREKLIIDSESVKRVNSDGRIPVVVTLAPTSLSAPTGPPPLHFMVTRQTYLHIGLAKAISRLHLFAPSAFQGMKWQEPDPGESDGENEAKEPLKAIEAPNSELPACWWEDEATQTPLRWQFFTGVLYDMHAYSALPWRLRLHFNNFPSELLPFSIQSLRSQFQNSIKQAIALRAGSGRAALQWLTKEAHEDLWNRLYENNQGTRHEWRSKLTEEVQNQRIPVRVLTSPGSPYLQKSCLEWLPDVEFIANTERTETSMAVTGASWKVQGIRPPLDVSVMDLWECLCHPDWYLYIVVTTT